MEILLTYNPYKLETTIKVNETTIKDALWDQYKYERIQVWIDKLFDLIEEQINSTEFTFIFNGTELDYEDVLEQVEIYNTVKGFSINPIHLPARHTEDKIGELRTLFSDIQEGPFEDLKDPVIKKNFEEALGNEFEVSVIATMSSGKSTLINALLGREIMPSKNEACTATVSRIKDVDGKTQFSAVCKDIEHNVIDTCDNLDHLKMEEWNKENVSLIEIEGEIPSIDSQDIRLVLVDTPGPNNSKTQEHKAHTFKLIHDSAKPMVMYILNATQLQTNDDNALLSAVAQEMSIDGKQSKDRFLFVINKMDGFDPDKEDIPSVINNVKEYLEKHGIHNPNIYPASAELAKVIRMRQNGATLTRLQRQTFNRILDFIEVPEYHFTEYASLAPSAKRNVTTALNNAIENDDEEQQALIHSGIPAIEEAINEYLQKYAYTAKLKNAVDTFKKKIEEKELLGNMTLQLKENENQRQELLHQIQSVREIINDGKKAKDFETKINNIQFNNFKNQEIRKLATEVENRLSGLAHSERDRMETYEAETLARKVNDSVENLFYDIKEKLNSALEQSVKKQASTYVEEYKKYVADLLQKGMLQSTNYTSQATVQLIQTNIPSADQIIQQYTSTETMVVDREWVKNDDFRWWKPGTWKLFGGSGKGYYRDIKETKQYVDAKGVINELLTPVRTQFDENFQRVNAHAENEAKKLKQFFINQMKEVDKVINAKLKELEKLSGDATYLDQEIARNQEKMEWLKEIIIRLNTILDI